MRRYLLTISALAILFVALGAGAALAGPPAWPLAQGGAPAVVSYQGQVMVAGVAYNGKGYFKFAVVDAGGSTTYWSNDDTASGEPANAVELTVSNGLFTVLLGDSGMKTLSCDAFDGSERYLRVWFAGSADGPFQRLEPDRRIAAVPYALQATNADALDGQHAAAFWQLGGNAGSDPASNYLGTSDDVALELKVNGARALRLEPNATSPNVIGGHWGNWVGEGVIGATIGGGGFGSDKSYWNSVTGSSGTVGGGAGNTAGGYYATVGGGRANTANGESATVAGGADNHANGECSFAGGRQATAAHKGAFVWGDATSGYLHSTGDNQFIVRASGGAWLYTHGGLTTGVKLESGSGAWASVSDRAAKENLAPVDQQALLARLAAIPISTWNYTTQDPAIRHVGPMAQDFNALLPDLGGEGETYINTLDADGVALAAIQGLYQRAQEQAARIDQLEAENAALRQGMADIEARLAALEQGR